MSEETGETPHERFTRVRESCETCGPHAACDGCLDALRAYLRAKMEEMVGTRDLAEANRRARVLNEWRMET